MSCSNNQAKSVSLQLVIFSQDGMSKLTVGLTSAFIVNPGATIPRTLPALTNKAGAFTPFACLNNGLETSTPLIKLIPFEAGVRVAKARERPPPME